MLGTMALLFAVIVISIATAMSLPPVIRIGEFEYYRFLAFRFAYDVAQFSFLRRNVSRVIGLDVLTRLFIKRSIEFVET